MKEDDKYYGEKQSNQRAWGMRIHMFRSGKVLLKTFEKIIII